MHIKKKYAAALEDYVFQIRNLANPYNTFNSNGDKQMGMFLIDYNPDSLGFETFTIRPCFDSSWEEYKPDSYLFKIISFEKEGIKFNQNRANALFLVYNEKTKRTVSDQKELSCWKEIVQDRVYIAQPKQERLTVNPEARPWRNDSTKIKERLSYSITISCNLYNSRPSAYTYELERYRKAVGERVIRFRKDSDEFTVKEW